MYNSAHDFRCVLSAQRMPQRRICGSSTWSIVCITSVLTRVFIFHTARCEPRLGSFDGIDDSFSMLFRSVVRLSLLVADAMRTKIGASEGVISTLVNMMRTPAAAKPRLLALRCLDALALNNGKLECALFSSVT